ncbi:MAG: hypothetical protein WD358_08845 [Nitriliruptoraceae bacterium]
MLALVVSACASVTERVDNVRSSVGSVAERARACVELVQAFGSFDEPGADDDPEQALETLREIVERSPEEFMALMNELESLVEQAAQAEADGRTVVTDPEFRQAARHLAGQATSLCATG